jgi:hypothetical protein
MGLLGAASLIAPVGALALLPFPGSPIGGQGERVGDLLLIPALLVVQPLCRAALMLRADGLEVLGGARELGRLITGLFPVLFATAALVEVSDTRSLLVGELGTAPETGAQFVVRVLAGLTLLLALPFWLEGRGAGEQTDAAFYAGTFLQRSALAAFWALLVLPMPGMAIWGVALYVGGALFAYAAMRLAGERLGVGRRERDAAGLVWATALPAAVMSLAVAIWSGV